MKKLSINRELLPVYIGMILSLLFFGSYFEFASCILTIYFIAYYFYLLSKKKFIQVDISVILMIVIVMSYLIFIPFAVDLGVAFIGFVKFLPLIPFVLVISQFTQKEREGLLKIIPILGCVMVIISSLLSLIEPIESYLNVNGRLSGFFQYPNTFAVFLLVGIIILIEEYEAECKKQMGVQTLYILVLLYGMFQSGSRTCIIFLAVFVVVSCVLKPLRKGGILLIGLLGSGVIATLLYTVLVDGTSAVSRYLTISLGESTFLGRMLYAKDALGQILTHPMGLGYMGYQYTQGEFQTGVYEVAYVHNDFLQLFLDAGWLAGLAMIILVIRAVKSKRNTLLCKLVVIFLSLCTLLDFHLQFIAMFMILILALDYAPVSEELYQLKCKTKHTKKTKNNIRRKTEGEFLGILKVKKAWKYSLGGMGLIISIYMLLVLGMEYFNFDTQSLMFYPSNTRIYISQLTATDNLEESNELADEILVLNECIAIAYREKSVYAFSQGEIEEMVNYKLEEIQYGKYNLTTYT